MLKINPLDYDLIIKIKDENDIVISRQMAKNFAQKLDFSLVDVTKIATAVSELARNIYRYAKEGYIYIKKETKANNPCIKIVATDEGPGIQNVDQAIAGGFTTSEKSLGLGLSGVRRLMDDFYIHSEVGKGTTVIIEKRRRYL
ncbi:serine/threonine-protein kinase RsbT [Caldanaerobius fijiensis DSM 17918]|uniref:Serine/threonine-protein kinase RsbT n=1 Tax=Caldanaerobius fijiensis DSM 17918 TaxID=1121256 RepID=A0A1M5CX61_9THEO|nr:anti-sigma regulatory factor [Caldanaerobius fijiensis]SHF59275.1 serine/threonine-protein kinase RsbT [Caldanaerobius fijiensis DSM 17918]